MLDWDKVALVNYDCKEAETLFRLTDKNRLWLRKWLVWVDNVQSSKDSLDFIEKCIASKLLGYFIYYDGKMIGTIGIVRVDESTHFGDVGYWIDHEMQGKGVITWAVQKFVAEVKRENVIDTLIIRCVPDNFGSKRVAEKCGFKYIKTVKDGGIILGQKFDLLIYHYVVKNK